MKNYFKAFTAIISVITVIVTVIVTVLIYNASVYATRFEPMEMLLMHPLKALFDEYPIWEAIIDKR